MTSTKPLGDLDLSGLSTNRGFPGDSVVKNSPANVGDARDTGAIPGSRGSRKSPRGGHGNPLQYSCLGNPRGQRSLVGYSP